MAGQLSQKETTMLQGQLHHEEVCSRKYSEYARRSTDPVVRSMFTEFARDEQDHCDTLSRLLGATNQQAVSATGHPGLRDWNRDSACGPTCFEAASLDSLGRLQALAGAYPDDQAMLSDMLVSENTASGACDAAIAEAASPVVRQALERIKEDETRHGEGILQHVRPDGVQTMQQPQGVSQT